MIPHRIAAAVLVGVSVALIAIDPPWQIALAAVTPTFAVFLIATALVERREYRNRAQVARMAEREHRHNETRLA